MPAETFGNQAQAAESLTLRLLASSGPLVLVAPLHYFVHIPKTAGTTVRMYLHDSFADDEVLFIYPAPVQHPTAHQATLEQAAAMPHAQLRSYRVFYGHYVFRPDRLLDEGCRGLAFVREPAARVVSWFHYVAGLRPEGCTPRQRRHVEAIRGGADLGALVEREGDALAEIDNGLVRYIGGAAGVPFGGLDEEHLRTAQRHVERHFDFVGHAARFEDSMQEIGKILGRPYEARPAVNRSAAGPAEKMLDRFDRSLLDRLTALDRAFVAWIEERFLA